MGVDPPAYPASSVALAFPEESPLTVDTIESETAIAE